MSEQNPQRDEGQQGAPPPPPPPPPAPAQQPEPTAPEHGQQQHPQGQQHGDPALSSTPEQPTATMPMQEPNSWQQSPDSIQTTSMPVAAPQRHSVVPGAPQHAGAQQQHDTQVFGAPGAPGGPGAPGAGTGHYGQQMPAHQVQGQQEAKPARKRSGVALVLVAILALVIGLGGGYAARMLTTDATASDEYQEQQQKLKAAEDERSEAIAARDEALKEAADAQAAAERAEERVGEVEESSTALQQELDERSNTLDDFETELNDREQELDQRASDLEALDEAAAAADDE